jgi:hypothetical protein
VSNASWTMGFLALLALYGSVLPPDSTGHYLDYNGDGVIDLQDLLDHLTYKPQMTGVTVWESQPQLNLQGS